MTDNSAAAARLTRNQSLVFSALSDAEAPLSAYTILDRLREEGFRAPLQVYRALDKLVEFGMVHRLESLNAFVACSHPECDTHESAIFTICEECGGVEEFAGNGLVERIRDLARDNRFSLRKSTIELRGICMSCRAVG